MHELRFADEGLTNRGACTVSGGCFAERLNDFVPLTHAERSALDRLEERERQVRRGATLLRAETVLRDLSRR